MATIDRLEIQVEAQISNANKQLSLMVDKLGKISKSLTGIDSNSLSKLSKSIQKFARSTNQLSDVETSGFTQTVKNIKKISGINTEQIRQTALSMTTLSKSLRNIGPVSKSSAQVAQVAKNIAKLGGANVQKAITNLPQFATAINNFMNTMSKAPHVSKNVVKMTQALANFANQSGRVGTSSKSIISGLNGFSAASSRAHKHTLNFAAALGKLYASFFVIIKAVKSLGNAIKSSMDYVETYNYFSVTMDKIGKEFGSQYQMFGYENAEAYAESFSERLNDLTKKMTGYTVGENGELFSADAKNLGLDPNLIMNFQARIGAVTNSVGLFGETSINTSKALSMLSADLSSLTNVDLKSVMTNLSSGIIGQSRALYKYGIDITNANLANYALAYGISKSVSEMSQSEKMQLRLLAILDQSKVAWGDQANTINSVANQYRIFKQQIANLARVIGNLFLPIVQAVLPVINGMVIALRQLLETIGANIWGDNWLKDIMDGISGGSADGFEDMEDSLDDMESSAGNLSDSFNDAENSAKKLVRTIMGFDQINKLNDANPFENNFGDLINLDGLKKGAVDLTDAISNALKNYEDIWEKALSNSENLAQKYADSIINAFKNGDFKSIGEWINNKLTNALNSINWQSVYQGARNFGAGLANFLNGLISPELFGAVGRAIAGALNTAIYAALSFGKTFDFKNLGMSIAEGVNQFFSTFDFAAFAETINTWVLGIWDALSTAIKNIDWSKVWDGIKTFISNLDIKTVSILIGAFALKFAGKVLTSTIFKDIIAGIILGKGGASIAAEIGSVTAAVGGLVSALSGFALLGGVLVGLELFTDSISEIAESFGRNAVQAEYLEDRYNGLGGKINVLKDYFSITSNAINGFGLNASNSVGAVNALEHVMGKMSKGTIYADESLEKMRQNFGLTNEDMEMLRQTMLDAHPELRELADGFGYLNSSAESLENIRRGMELIENGTVSTSEAFERFSEPIWQMTEQAKIFFKHVQNGNIQLGDYKKNIENTGQSIEKFGTDVANATNYIGEGLSNGMKNIDTDNPSKLFFDKTVRSINQQFDMHSPAKKMYPLGENILLGINKGFSGEIPVFSKSIEQWYGGSVSPWFTSQRWNGLLSTITQSFSNVFEGLESIISQKMGNAYNAVSSWVSNIRSLINGIFSSISGVFGSISGSLFGRSNFSLNMPSYKAGGFPEDGLFFANHNEVVGKFSNGKTAVANNEQITNGIRDAVYDAVMQAMMNNRGNQNDNMPFIINAVLKTEDNEVLARSVEKGRLSRDMRFQPVIT